MREEMRIIPVALVSALIVAFIVQGALHKAYVHIAKFNPAAARCDALQNDLSLLSIEPRGKCIEEMFAAMDEGNDFLWFLHGAK